MLLTAAIDRADIVTALQLGARGIVLKESASDVLLKSIDAVVGGKYWVGRKPVADLNTTLSEIAAAFPAPTRKQFGLTPRELEIVGVILAGCSNNDIASKFKISEKTVKHHLTNIFDKLGVSNRMELALFALYHKLSKRQRHQSCQLETATITTTESQRLRGLYALEFSVSLRLCGSSRALSRGLTAPRYKCRNST